MLLRKPPVLVRFLLYCTAVIVVFVLLWIWSVPYTALRLYAGDELLYECGFPGSYPDFLIDPPTIVTLVTLPDSTAPQELRFEYYSPSVRTTMDLPRLEYGEEASILTSQFHRYNVSLILTIFFLVLGAIMVCAAFFYLRKTPDAAIFIQLGIFSLAVGAWSFGECPYFAFMFPHPGTLYLISYYGLFLLTLPFLRFLELTLKTRFDLWIRTIRYILSVIIFAAFILQATGQSSLAHNFFTYEVVASAVLIVLMVFAIVEVAYYKNPTARLFIAPLIVASAAAFLSFLNYEIRFLESLILIFQIGAFIFIFQLVMIAARFIWSAYAAFAEREAMELRLQSMNRQIVMQRDLYERLVGNSEQVKAMRHDLRHQLTVIETLNEAGDTEGIREYIKGMSGGLSHGVVGIYSGNYAVNAVAAHYLTLAEDEGVRVDVRLNIPGDTGRIPVMDICVVVGNLFENAVEALHRFESGDKYIRARARVTGNALTLIVENSFDGTYKQTKDETYLSAKPDGGRGAEDGRREGIGLTSVKAVCEKYGGLLRVDIEDKTWRVSAILNL